MQKHDKNHDGNDVYREGSISLGGAVAMGTGVMIGAGIFALTGQIAQQAGPLFPFAFILMALSMVIAESLVARTFATYVLRPLDITGGPLVPVLAVAVIVFAFLVNIAGNRSVGLFSLIMAAIKIGGIALFGIAALWSSGFQFAAASETAETFGVTGFIASVALAILAFKGFTTITNSGGEITDPHRNVGRTIMLSIAICVVVYLLVAFGVGASLTIDEIIAARDYSLAQAAEPALGQVGFYLTVVLAAVATASGVLASVFAVSRMLTMLTEMKMIPHSHFGMSGAVQRHMLVYTVVIASTLAVLFDLGRIASLGAFFYLVMDMIIHWGVFRYRRTEVGASSIVLLSALSLDAIVLAAFTVMKLQSDPMIVLYAAVFAFERVYLSRWVAPQAAHSHGE